MCVRLRGAYSVYQVGIAERSARGSPRCRHGRAARRTARRLRGALPVGSSVRAVGGGAKQLGRDACTLGNDLREQPVSDAPCHCAAVAAAIGAVSGLQSRKPVVNGGTRGASSIASSPAVIGLSGWSVLLE